MILGTNYSPYVSYSVSIYSSSDTYWYLLVFVIRSRSTTTSHDDPVCLASRSFRRQQVRERYSLGRPLFSATIGSGAVFDPVCSGDELTDTFDSAFNSFD